MIEERRGPGRPPKYHEAIQQAPVPQDQPSAIDAPAMPARRKPFGGMEQKLAYPQRAGFHSHWFNDIPGRIDRAKEAGYTHIQDKDGKNVCRVVGIAEGGGPLHAYNMEIPEEWYQEDMAAQKRIVDEKEEAMKRGELEAQPGDKRYVPSQGISIKHG